jgi:hypothetical protein
VSNRLDRSYRSAKTWNNSSGPGIGLFAANR